MIIGRQLVERMYSDYDEYDGLNEALERAFCEGYEYAQREFGDEEKKKSKKMKLGDKISLWGYKHSGKKAHEAERDRILNEIDPEATERQKKRDKKPLLLNPAVSALAGALAGAGSTAFYNKKNGTKGDVGRIALIGAGIGAGVGAASGVGAYSGSRLGSKIKKKRLNKSEKYRKGWEKQNDLLDVSEGKMSEDEFIEKWGK